MDTKRFHAKAVLSVVPGRLVGSMDDVYEILNWMTNDNLFTHQLPRASRECKPWLMRWFPKLADVHGESLAARLSDDMTPEQCAFACKAWVSESVATLGQEWFEVPRIPRDDHETIDPIAEAVALFGKDRVIKAQVRDEGTK